MARMRHPNVVSFMGLCRMPPCILTGEPAWTSLNSNRAAAAPATAATATAAAAAGAAAATAAAAARHRSSPATGPSSQSTAHRAPFTMCCTRRRSRPAWRRSSRGSCG